MNNEDIRNNSVNANLNIMNIIEKEEIRSTMMNTFIDLANKLKAHCGPYSGTAILTDPNNALAEPVFTKDGINIVSRMMYASPMQEFVRQQLAYMGTRVERSAGDGTTSTMIIMAYTLASLLKYFTNNDKYSYTNNDIAETWDVLIVDIVKKYDECKSMYLSLVDSDTVKFIAGSQAYTSSHGDKKLAECIAELFGSTPKEVWDTLTINKAIYESEEKYKVTIADAEYTLDNVALFPNDKCNKELGTVLELTDVPCIIQDRVAIGDDYQKNFTKYVSDNIVSGNPLIIVCSNFMDGMTQEYYQKLFTENPNHNTIFVLTPTDDAMLNDINALSVIAYNKSTNVHTDDINPFTVSVRFEGNTFRFLNGLLELKPENGINPYYKNPAYPTYNEFIDQVSKIIRNEKADATRNNSRAIRNFTRILHKLIATKDVVFTVGGQAYDNAAAVDIASDALIATKHSLTNGFVAGRCVTLRAVLEELKTQSNKFRLMKMCDLYHAFINALLSGISEVDKAIFDSVNVSDNISNTLKYKESPADFTRLDDPEYIPPVSLQKAIEQKRDYCIIQPIETDITFIKRFGEIGLKFLTATRVIATGYVYSDKK